MFCTFQMQAVPAMLSGYDVMASAPTGSGKTAAFVLPILLSLQSPSKHGNAKEERGVTLGLIIMMETEM